MVTLRGNVTMPTSADYRRPHAEMVEELRDRIAYPERQGEEGREQQKRTKAEQNKTDWPRTRTISRRARTRACWATWAISCRDVGKRQRLVGNENTHQYRDGDQQRDCQVGQVPGAVRRAAHGKGPCRGFAAAKPNQAMALSVSRSMTAARVATSPNAAAIHMKSVDCCNSVPLVLSPSIHRSAWKVCSRSFVCTKFRGRPSKKFGRRSLTVA